MKPKLFFVLFTLIAAPALAQMTVHYSTYVTYSAEATSVTGGTIYVSAVVDGTASCAPGYSLCDSIYHQGQVRVSIAGNSTTVYGSHVLPTGYVSVTNGASSPATPGDDLEIDSDGEVYCSGIGGFIFTDILIGTTGLRLSAYISTGPSEGLCTWTPTCEGSCSVSSYTTNPNSQGQCYTNGQIYRQCLDFEVGGSCVIRRIVCAGRISPGSCT